MTTEHEERIRESKEAIERSREARGDILTKCAWCGKRMGGPVDASRVSHGICEDCSKEMEARI